jgi:hypothetical protein
MSGSILTAIFLSRIVLLSTVTVVSPLICLYQRKSTSYVESSLLSLHRKERRLSEKRFQRKTNNFKNQNFFPSGESNPALGLERAIS